MQRTVRNGVFPALGWMFVGTLALCGLCSCAAFEQGQADRPVRIALLADPHLNLKTTGAAAVYSSNFEKALAAANAAKVDLVLIAGDVTNSGSVEEMALFKQRIKGFHAPVWFVPGNHDLGQKVTAEEPGKVTTERLQAYEKELGTTFFVRHRAGLRIIAINSVIFGSGFAEEAEEWRMLEQELAKPGAEPTLLLSHYPLFVETLDEPSSYFNIDPQPRRRLLALARQGGVRAILSGHVHRPIEHREDGILLLSAGPLSFGLPKNKTPESWMLVSVPPKGEPVFEFRGIE